MNVALKVKISALLILTIAVGACTSNQVITALQLAVDAATVAIPIVSAGGGVDPKLMTRLVDYLNYVSEALVKSSDILGNGQTPAAQAAAITKAFADIATPELPPGLPAGISSAIALVAERVGEFLSHLPKTPPSSTRTLLGTPPGKPVVLSEGQKKTLEAIHRQAVLDQLAAQEMNQKMRLRK